MVAQEQTWFPGRIYWVRGGRRNRCIHMEQRNNRNFRRRLMTTEALRYESLRTGLCSTNADVAPFSSSRSGIQAHTLQRA
jgi:hypothetical protein